MSLFHRGLKVDSVNFPHVSFERIARAEILGLLQSGPRAIAPLLQRNYLRRNAGFGAVVTINAGRDMRSAAAGAATAAMMNKIEILDRIGCNAIQPDWQTQ